jgi:NADH-quinone oxidoreductase subunit M
MVLLGMFQRAWVGVTGMDAAQGMLAAVLAVSGVILGAWYMLVLVQKVFFGPLKEPHHEGAGHEHEHHEEVRDLSLREILALAPLVVFMLWIGLKPQDFLPAIDRPVRTVIAGTDQVMQTRSAENEPTALSPQAIPQENVARVR